MKSRLYIFIHCIVAIVALHLASCIKNDIPYPYIELEILSIEGEGFSQKSIDTKSREVTLLLDEATDITNVVVTDAKVTEGALLTNEIVGMLDLSSTFKTTLYQYQEYDWSIIAEQSIARSFKVSGQIGDEEIDLDNFTATVYVNKNSVDMQYVELLDLKLGAEGVTTYSPTLEELAVADFTTYQSVTVTTYGVSQEWRLYVEAVEPSVDFTIDTWGTIAWLRAEGDTSGDKECYFTYRKVGDSSWSSVYATTIASGYFEGKVTGLSPQSEYEFEAFISNMNSGSKFATTEGTPQLPNSDFERWQKPNNPWLPYASGDSEYWATGNEGSTILSSSKNVTMPDYSNLAPGTLGSTSALLASNSVFGVFAAGNIFTGQFVSIAGLSGGIIALGRPFTERPLGLTGWVKYDSGSVTNSGGYLSKGDDDMGSIYIALGEWDYNVDGKDSNGNVVGDADSPFVVDTRDESTFFDPNHSGIIAYQSLILEEDQDWTNFTLELEYRDEVDSDGNVITPSYSRVPTHIIIVCSSSRYGDYFTGSTSSSMWIDDFELVYE